MVKNPISAWVDTQLQKLTLIDRVVLLVCICSVVAASAISRDIFENIPHLEDEYAYVWQAEVAARGEITRPIPDCPRCFLVPFIVDYDGHRFGKYQLPWPVMLSFGIRLGLRYLVNPLLAGLSVWLMYLLTRKLRDKFTGLIAAILLAASPFFLINASTLLSHTFSLFLTLVFFISWLDVFRKNCEVPAWLPIATAGLSLGLLFLSRPLTAIGVSFPIILHGFILMIKGDNQYRKLALIIGLIVISLLPIHFLWQYALTGDPLLNPYTIVWPYDTIGFGPGIGRQTGGYQLSMAWGNIRSSLHVGYFDLFGWGRFSWILLPLGLLLILRDWKTLMITSTLATMIAAYTLYWIGSNLLGPRYYYEALPACVLLTAIALRWLLGLPEQASGWAFWRSWRTWRFVFFSTIAALAVSLTVFFYLPARLPRFIGLYGASAERLTPFIQNDKPGITPALVIVYLAEGWTDYSTLTELSNPYFDTPFVFILNKGEEANARAINMLPGRIIWHYYPDEPFLLRSMPR
jgi:hypothetical protein